MKKPFLIFLFVAVSFVFSSCSKNDGANFHFLPLQIVSAELPDFFSLDQTYNIRVTYNKPDDCTSFGGFDIIPEGDTTRNVVVIGTKRTDQETCSQAIIEETSTFNFKVVHFETYIFRFWHGEDAEGNQEYFDIAIPVR